MCNSEARRHNALVRSSGLGEPLKPLLRPLQLSAGQAQDASVDPDASEGDDKNKNDAKPDKKEAKNKDKDKSKGRDPAKDKDKRNPKDDNRHTTGIPTPPSTAASVASGTTSCTARPGPGPSTNRLSVNTALSAATSTAVTAFEGPPATGSALSPGGVTVDSADLAGGWWWDVVAPTPSPRFPRTLAALVALSADQARALVREYGLPAHEDGDGDGDGNPTPRSAGAGRGGNARGGRGGARGGGCTGRTERPASVGTACSDTSSWANAGLAGTREDDLNRFMRYIGVSDFCLGRPLLRPLSDVY